MLGPNRTNLSFASFQKRKRLGIAKEVKNTGIVIRTNAAFPPGVCLDWERLMSRSRIGRQPEKAPRLWVKRLLLGDWPAATEAAAILAKARAMLQQCELEQDESIAQDLLAKLRLP